MPDIEPDSTTFLYGLVMVPREMRSALTSRIYKNGAKPSASGAVSPEAQWSIPTIRADYFTFASKVLQIWPYLLVQSQER